MQRADLPRARPLESRMLGNLHVRFGGGRMEKDAAGFPQGLTNSGTRRTSPAAYPTPMTFGEIDVGRAPHAVFDPGETACGARPTSARARA